MDGARRKILKKIFKKTFFLPPPPMLLIAVPSYLFVIYVLSDGTVNRITAYLAYLVSAYAFIITAVINAVKFRKYKSPILSAAKVISLTAALVSVLSLETAMLAQFWGADDPVFCRIMATSTGTGVSLAVLGMAGYMIVRSTKETWICQGNLLFCGANPADRQERGKRRGDTW